MAKPLSAARRKRIIDLIRLSDVPYTPSQHDLLAYEATVSARDDRIAALEADNARLEAERADRRDKAFQAVLEKMAEIEKAGVHECSTCRSWKERIGDVDPRGPYQEGHCCTLGIDTLNDFSCIYWLVSDVATTGDNPHVH